MYIRKTISRTKGKTYTNYLLVESVRTPKGPRQRTICSLGSLDWKSPEEWLSFASKIEESLAGQQNLFSDPSDPHISKLLESIKCRRNTVQNTDVPPTTGTAFEQIDTSKVEIEDAREAGPVYAGNSMYQKIGFDPILENAGLHQRTRDLVRAMVLNRLIAPCSEHAMPEWINRTALSDLVNVDFSSVDHNMLYRMMDNFYNARTGIEKALRRNECELFGLDDTVFFYDLTSHYFEGECLSNPQAKRGYSRDSRPDCKQVVVGLVVDKDGFPISHEVFDGNRQDSTTVGDMLDMLSKNRGSLAGATVVVDRGMSSEKNLQMIRDRGCHYIVAAKQSERDQWLEELEEDEAFYEVERLPSPTNPFQEKPIVQVRQLDAMDGTKLILCKSEGRVEKDRAIRVNFETKWLRDIEKLSKRISDGKLRDEKKIYETIGRLKERYPRVARYYDISYQPQTSAVEVVVKNDRRETAQRLDGSYIIKTDRGDLSETETWKIYSLLTKAENAFRCMKSPLDERPIFHQLQHRVQTHIFLCVLAYHLLIAIEKQFLSKKINTSWATIRKKLSTHQIVTVVLPSKNGKILRIRKATKPEQDHLDMYQVLELNPDIITPRKRWTDPTKCSDVIEQ